VQTGGRFSPDTWLGPLTFITIIDDLQPPCAVHKFVDDTTLTDTRIQKYSKPDG